MAESIKINIKIDDKDFKKIMDNKHKIMADFVNMVANETWGNIKRFAPKDHGRLANSFQLKKITDLSYKIISGVEYAEWVDRGTGIYGPYKQEIKPRVAKALYFVTGNKEIFAKAVKGQKGSNYTGRAANETAKRLDEFMRTILYKYDNE